MKLYNKILLSIILTLPITTFSQTGFNAYFGNLHSHTGNSDGTGTPSEAYIYAINTAGLDFHAVTDHLEQIDPLEWYNLITTANSNTVDGSFIAIYGWEWGSPLHGHINVFNTDILIYDIGWLYTDYDGFRQWVIDNPPAFAQFNHPGDPTYATTWNNFQYYDAPSDSALALMEFQNAPQATDWYEAGLIKGWHLSPVWNQDNHSADWGTKDNGRAGIWATSLTRASLFEAIKRRRTFATMDKNASVWLDISGIPMGSISQPYYDAPIHIKFTDPDNEIWTTIQLVNQTGVIQTFSSTSATLDTVITYSPLADNWIFVRAIQADGDYLWSAPVHFQGSISSVSDYKSDLFSFYPSPAKDKITVSFSTDKPDDISLSIIDITGKIIKSFVKGKCTLGQNTIICSLSDLTAGAYFLQFTEGNNSGIKKLIITK
jgi:hypothetical protein